MSEKSLNYLIFLFIFVFAGGLFVLPKGVLSDGSIWKYARYIHMAVFATIPLLLIIKVNSRCALIALKDRPIRFIENLFIFFYFLLTKEARKEWRDYINKKSQG